MADFDFTKEVKSSMRKVFIRVSLENETKEEGKVIYTYDGLRKTVREFCKKYKNCKFAMIYHDRDIDEDGNLKHKHVHIYIQIENALRFSAFKKTFPYKSFSKRPALPAKFQKSTDVNRVFPILLLNM